MVLVVDDSETVRLLVRNTIASEFSIAEAADGLSALDIVEAGGVGLILCDVNMPRMDGMQFLSELRGRGHAVPVVMLTTDGRPALIRRARDLGARGWIVKPFQPELLLQAVRRLMEG